MAIQVTKNVEYVIVNDTMVITMKPPYGKQRDITLPLQAVVDFTLTAEMQVAFDARDQTQLIYLMRRDIGWTIPKCICALHWKMQTPPAVTIN